MSCYLGAALAACGPVADRPAAVDLLTLLPSAERRAAGNLSEAVRADVFAVDGDARMALVLHPPARVTWTVRLPAHARLTFAVAGRGRVRVGLAAGRTYQEAGQVTATGPWEPVAIDLRDFSEVKWSLFYQPLRIDWRLIINADATDGATSVALERPVITKS